MPTPDDRPFSPFEPKSEDRLWKLVLAVFLGFCMAGLLGFAVRMYLVNRAIDQFGDQMRQIGVQSQRLTEHFRLQADQQRRQSAEAARAVQQAKDERARAAGLAEREKWEAQKVAEVEARRKETAWERYYKRPASCENAQGDAFIECGNHHIRARRKFDELYAKGAL